MASRNQASKTPKVSRRAIKLRMLDKVTNRELAQKIGHDEATVSKAINHGLYPRVRAKIAEALGV
jgi:hypothetical protein